MWAIAMYYSGSILCTGVTIGTVTLPNSTSWRAPLAIQLVPAGIMVIFVWFLPEVCPRFSTSSLKWSKRTFYSQSPRWLISQGRTEEARAVLAKYHGNGDPHAPLVELEWKEFEESIMLNASDKRWWDYSELVNTPNARYRTYMMLMMGFFGQWSGNGLGCVRLQFSVNISLTLETDIS